VDLVHGLRGLDVPRRARIDGGAVLRVRPCIPDAWAGFTVRLRLPDGKTRYEVEVVGRALPSSLRASTVRPLGRAGAARIRWYAMVACIACASGSEARDRNPAKRRDGGDHAWSTGCPELPIANDRALSCAPTVAWEDSPVSCAPAPAPG
jgi:hypothetical protein